MIKKLRDHSILNEIFPVDWIYISKWMSAEKLLYYESTGFDVSGFFEYDIQQRKNKRLNYIKGSILSNADYYKDGSLITYVDDSGKGDAYTTNLHLVNVKLNNDNIVASKRSILDPKISYNKEYIAFFEVEYDIGTGKSIDNVWIYSIKNKSLKKIYKGPAKPKIGGRDEFAWSFDNQYLGMFHPTVALVLKIQSPKHVQIISGKDFQWIKNNNIIFSQGMNIYIYSLKNKKKELLFENATKPAFLLK